MRQPKSLPINTPRDNLKTFNFGGIPPSAPPIYEEIFAENQHVNIPPLKTSSSQAFLLLNNSNQPSTSSSQNSFNYAIDCFTVINNNTKLRPPVGHQAARFKLRTPKPRLTPEQTLNKPYNPLIYTKR